MHRIPFASANPPVSSNANPHRTNTSDLLQYTALSGAGGIRNPYPNTSTVGSNLFCECLPFGPPCSATASVRNIR